MYNNYHLRHIPMFLACRLHLSLSQTSFCPSYWLQRVQSIHRLLYLPLSYLFTKQNTFFPTHSSFQRIIWAYLSSRRSWTFIYTSMSLTLPLKQLLLTRCIQRRIYILASYIASVLMPRSLLRIILQISTHSCRIFASLGEFFFYHKGPLINFSNQKTFFFLRATSKSESHL